MAVAAVGERVWLLPLRGRERGCCCCGGESVAVASERERAWLLPLRGRERGCCCCEGERKCFPTNSFCTI